MKKKQKLESVQTKSCCVSHTYTWNEVLTVFLSTSIYKQQFAQKQNCGKNIRTVYSKSDAECLRQVAYNSPHPKTHMQDSLV
jgi:hypothetical protein